MYNSQKNEHLTFNKIHRLNIW